MAGGEPFPVLAGAVAPQSFCGLVGAFYGAALAVLGFLEDGAGSGLAEGALYVERSCGTGLVYVGPFEAEELALS